MPGLLAVLPPRKAARGREQDRLIVYLALTGTAVFSTTEYFELASTAATGFYQTQGAITAALRSATESINQVLLQRNMKSSGLGQYALGWLSMLVLRDTNLTLLLTGPMHAYILNSNEARHIYEPALSGKGLGLSQNATHYFTQAQLQPHDRLLISGRIPSSWASTLSTPEQSTLEGTRRKLTVETQEDLHALLMQTTTGNGALNILKSSAEISAASPASLNLPQTIETESTPQPALAEPVFESSVAPSPTTPREFPSSIPRAKTREESIPQLQDEPVSKPKIEQSKMVVPPEIQKPVEPSESTKKAAQVMVRSIRASRRANESIGQGLQKFLPRLLPDSGTGESFIMSPAYMFVISVIVPLIIVTMASVVYFRFGRSAQFEESIIKARAAREQANIITDPTSQRDAWESVLIYIESAEEYRVTDETTALRVDAEQKRDQLLGISRLQFTPAFSNGLGIQISRMAASETDLFMLDALSGSVMRATLTSRGLQIDAAFNCKPDAYGSYQVGAMVDILTLPLSNSINATLLGVDAAGNLLYCAPGQVAQAIPLPLPITNWGRVTAMTLDAGNLYVLDSQSSALWVYVGLGGAFVDSPYFFFGGQIPALQDAIDIAVSGDDLYILHADGHISLCSYSRIQSVPTRCQDPAPLINPFPAYQDTDLFGTAHITQMMFSAPPDPSILLLDADSRSVFRIAPRTMELQNQLKSVTGASNPISSGVAGSMTYGPNHVLYIAIDDNVYFGQNEP